jgi:hypothetical protein
MKALAELQVNLKADAAKKAEKDAKAAAKVQQKRKQL